MTNYAEPLHVAEAQHTIRLGSCIARVDVARNWVVFTRYHNGTANTVGLSGDEITDALAVLRTAGDWLGQGPEGA